MRMRVRRALVCVRELSRARVCTAAGARLSGEATAVLLLLVSALTIAARQPNPRVFSEASVHRALYPFGCLAPPLLQGPLVVSL
jgi:hypothetical protein